jgi:DNA-binding LacI/PurR family transcriptional regulator
MRLAFKGLEKSGLVRKDKHGWRLSNFQTSRYGTVWVIGPSDAAGHFSFDGDRQGAFVEALRQQATDRGVTLRFIGSDRLQDRRPVSSDEIPIGVIVWADGYTHSSLTKILERISHRLRQGPSLPPLVLFSSVPIETENWGVKHFPRFRFLHLASHSAGQAMGDLLRQNGFRDIAFLSPCLDEKWSQQRQKGLAVSLKKGGLPPLKVAGLSGSYQPLELHALHENAKKGFTALKALTHLRIPQSADHLYHLSEGLLHHALEILRQDLYYRRLIPQMKALLSDKRIGVWVCANDTTASIALAFLRSQGIKVPREMSLVSFDNRLHSVAADLTTFDFRIDRAASMALGYLLYPDAKPYRHLLHVEVPGSVIIRGSLKRTNGITPSKR